MTHVSLRWFVFALLSTGLASAGCPSEVGPRPGAGNCGVDQECPEGRACQESVCVAACEGTADCESGVCEVDSGLCVDCLTGDDCGDGLVCNAFTHRCVVPVIGCTVDEECGGLRCDTGKGTCVECLADGDCSTGSVCEVITATCLVRQSCDTDEDCTDSVCDPVEHECVECVSGAQCDSGVCDPITATCAVGCVDDDASEPNQGSDAAPISPGGAHEGAICSGDVDEFIVEAAGTLTAVLTIDGVASLHMRLFDGDGALKATSTPTATGATVTALDLIDASYRIVVGGVSTADAGDYLLSVALGQPGDCPQLDSEPNDLVSQANTIVADDSLHAGAICGADTDLLRFTTTDGENVEAIAVVTEGTATAPGTIALAILDEEGTVVASGNPATLDDVDAGTFFVRVTATGGDVAYAVRVNASDVPVVCNQSDAEPNDLGAQALSLTPGKAAVGTICPGDIDTHRFAVAPLDDISVTVQGAGLSARLVRAIDGVQVGAGSTISLSDVAGGSYRLIIEGDSAPRQGSYTAQLVRTPEAGALVCNEGNIEPDARNDARALTLDGTPQAGRVCADDVDFFTLNLAEAATFRVHARFTNDAGDLDMRLTDQSGAILNTAISIDDDEILVQALPAGTYVVEVFGFASAANNYTMEAQLQTCAPDAFEQNNVVATATPIAGSAISAARCPGDDDFYLLRLDNGDAFSATLAGSGLTFSLVSVSNGALLASDEPDGGNRRLQVAGLPEGRYALRVTGASADRVPYTLTPVIAPTPSRCVDDGAHANDTSATAFALGDEGLLDGSYELGSLVSCAVGDSDWFTLPLRGQRQVSVQLAFDASDNIDVELLESRGTTGLTRVIASSTAADKQDRLSGTVDIGDTFFVRATGAKAGQTSYGIGIEVSDLPASSCVDDRFDTWTGTHSGAGADTAFTNDAPQDAVAVASGEEFTLRVCPANSDWLKIAAAVGQRVVVRVKYVHAANRDIDVALYGPTNQAVSVDDSLGITGIEDISFVAEDAGDHFIEVFGYNTSENFYDLRVTLE